MGLWDGVLSSPAAPPTTLVAAAPTPSPVQASTFWNMALTPKAAPMLPGLGGLPQSTFSFNPILDNNNEQSKTFLQKTLGPISNILNRISGAIIAPLAGTSLEKVPGSPIPLPQKFSSQVEQGANTVFGEKIGGPVAAGVSLIGDPLNLVGGEGPKGIELLTKLVTAAKTEGEVSKLMKGAGFADDIISHYAPVLAETSDATKVREGLMAAENLHNSTIVSAHALSEQSQALTDVRTSLAENLKTAATPNKRAAIQSQIDLIDQKLAARESPPLPERGQKPPLEQPAIGEGSTQLTKGATPESDSYIKEWGNYGFSNRQEAAQYAASLEKSEGGKWQAEKVGTDWRAHRIVNGTPKDIPQAVQAYKAKFIDEPNKNGGLVEISGDEMKKLNGGDYAPERSKLYSQEAYNLVKDEIAKGPKKDIVLLGGGSGSGKSELIGQDLKDSGFTGLLYDNSLSNYSGTKSLLDLAKQAGKNVEIHAILPDLDRARFFTLMREADTGRPVTDADFARSHAGFVETLTRLLENGDIAPENVHLFDTRGAEVEIPSDVLATLKSARYTEADILKNHGEETVAAKYENLPPPERLRSLKKAGQEAQPEDRLLSEKRISVGEGTQVPRTAQRGATKIDDRIPLPPTVGEVLSSRPTGELGRAIPPEPRETVPRAPQGEGSRTSDLTSPQDTTQKVDLSVKGSVVGEKVRNVIGRSQTLKTQIVNKGQEAYLAGRGLSNDDLATIRDGYQAGKPIEDIAKETSNPAKATTFIKQMASYYDYELAADRAAGGETARVERYLPQYWDLSNPVDKARWNEFAKQRGMQPYYGFRSQSKIFKTYAEGIAAGFTPARANILEDLKANYGSASNAISTQALKRGLKEAAPNMVGMSGLGITPEGKSFVNSNIPGLEGIAYHPAIDKMLQGFQPLKHADFIDMVKKSGAEAALEHVGIMGQVDKMVAMAKSAPANAKEAGLGGVLGSIYDHVTGPMKQVLWNWSGFHSVNITLSHMGASTLHPITGAKGVVQSVGSAVSERLYNATVNSYKDLMVGKDAAGKEQSVFDWAVESGAFEPRDLPAIGAEHFHPFSGGKRIIFDREIPVLQLNLAEQAARKGIVASSPEGIALGKEIRSITGEINAKTMNINPNTLKAASRAFLAPGFTFSKYKTLLDSFTAWGAEHGAAGNLARQAVIGKSAIVGIAATLGTLLATGKFPNLQQLLMNFSFNPSVQTNFSNPQGRKLDITFPKTFLAEGASAVLNPVAYGNARLNPLISDMLKLYTNQDYYGRPLVDPNVKTSTALQLAQNLGIGHLPIGAQAVINTLMGKQTALQGAIQVGGLGSHVSPGDPVMVKYAGIDHAKALISAIAPDDPNRPEKMQAIFNTLPEADRKSLAYQELLAGVSTKGIYQSEVERKYFQVQDMLKQGDMAGATAITKGMSKQDYSTYKSIKTRLAHQATFQQVKDLVAKGDIKGATALTGAMTKQEYASYQTWKKNNP